MTEKLKPCPFCGGTDIEVESSDYGGPYVFCNDCGALGPPTRWTDETADDHARARALWNTRHGGDHD